MKKVLIVDDTKNIRTLLTKCLQLEGYEVKSASDGYEAIQMFLNEKFDLAFLDIKMPAFSGTEVLKQIREKGITTPVIIITAYATIKNAVECTKMGAVAYLQKPFSADKVRNVLGELQKIACEEIEPIEEKLGKVEKMIEAKQYTEAIFYLKQKLRDNPLDAEVYVLLSKASGEMGLVEDAAKYKKIAESIGS